MGAVQRNISVLMPDPGAVDPNRDTFQPPPPPTTWVSWLTFGAMERLNDDDEAAANATTVHKVKFPPRTTSLNPAAIGAFSHPVQDRTRENATGVSPHPPLHSDSVTGEAMVVEPVNKAVDGFDAEKTRREIEEAQISDGLVALFNRKYYEESNERAVKMILELEDDALQFHLDGIFAQGQMRFLRIWCGMPT
ncbi:hypothetical protein BC830DRAFT_1228032 [Chytriomyces sp. MP71]|nr:hypothetical protein BC830DRAFT_1228032 [Chytriomyces sp. MP71]